MAEFESKIVFMEGPQGAGKTTATRYVSTLGYEPVRGIPTGERLVKNTTSQNWCQSLGILEDLVNHNKPYVSDRSFWSLVVFKMRKKPEMADSFYETGSRMFRRRINGTDHKVIIITAEPETCVARADQKSIVAITDTLESKKEIEAYHDLLKRLKEDGFKAFSIYNNGISEDNFKEEIRRLLN